MTTILGLELLAEHNYKERCGYHSDDSKVTRAAVVLKIAMINIYPEYCLIRLKNATQGVVRYQAYLATIFNIASSISLGLVALK